MGTAWAGLPSTLLYVLEIWVIKHSLYKATVCSFSFQDFPESLLVVVVDKDC